MRKSLYKVSEFQTDINAEVAPPEESNTTFKQDVKAVITLLTSKRFLPIIP
jgi:hypothetical protein